MGGWPANTMKCTDKGSTGRLSHLLVAAALNARGTNASSADSGHEHTQPKPSLARAVLNRDVSNGSCFFSFTLPTKPISANTRIYRKTEPDHSHVQAMPLRRAADGVVRPTLLLSR